jgi:16S rRNA (guanine966-N2)-methyltransferase
MRAAIFNRPDVQAVSEGRVLDLYAGAGLLGVEAISRGATSVDFVERDRRVCAVIQQNLAALEIADQGRVHCVPVERCRGRIEPPYDLCFADPPYPVDATLALERLVNDGLLRVGGLLLWRHLGARVASATLGPLVRSDRRRYGDGVLETYMAGAPA